MAPILQFKRGAAAAGVGTVPALRPGEPAISTNFYDLFVGLDTSVSGNRFFGSHRYWGREDGTTSLRLKLVDKDGTNSVNLKAPDTVAGIVTYTLPGTITAGNYLKVDANGQLSWASVSDGGSFINATFTNTSFSGISTFSGLVDANAGLDVTGGSTLDNLSVTGIATVGTTLDVNGLADLTNVNVSVAATIASADINGGTIDGTVIGGSTAAAGSFTTLSYNSSTSSGISTVGALYIGTDKVLSVENVNEVTLSGIDAIDAITKATLEASLALSPNNFNDINVSGISTFQQIANFGGGINVTSGVSTFAGLIDANAGLDVTGQTTLNTGLNVTSGVSTFAGLVDANAGLDVTGQTTLNNDLAVTGVSTFTGAITANGSVTLGDNTSDTLTVNANATFNGTLTGTASTATRAQGIDVTETTTGAEHYVTFVSNNTTTNAATLRVEGALAYNPSDNALKVATVRSTAIQHTDGVGAITIASNGNVGIAQTLTVEGDLTVKGSTTTVNTTELKVEDTLIDLGLENSSGTLIPPTTTTTTDVGTVLNYYSTAARKAAVYWDHTNTRVAVAASVTESAGVLTVQDWGTMAAGSILMNGKLTVNDCAGSSDVITCTAGQRFLDNITVDAGTF